MFTAVGASPWNGRRPERKPRRGESDDIQATHFRSSGARGTDLLVSRGLRPWLLAIAPPGLRMRNFKKRQRGGHGYSSLALGLGSQRRRRFGNPGKQTA